MRGAFRPSSRIARSGSPLCEGFAISLTKIDGHELEGTRLTDTYDLPGCAAPEHCCWQHGVLLTALPTLDLIQGRNMTAKALSTRFQLPGFGLPLNFGTGENHNLFKNALNMTDLSGGYVQYVPRDLSVQSNLTSESSGYRSHHFASSRCYI